MQYPNYAKDYYNRGRGMKAPLPNVENLLKEVKKNPKYENYIRNHNSQSRPHIKKSVSSMSNRSDSRDSYSNSERFYSNENSYTDICPTNDTSKDSNRNSQSKNLNKKSTITQPSRKAPPKSNDTEENSILKEISSFERYVIDYGHPPPHISPKCWAIMDSNTGEILYAKQENKRREIASLTKMMTIFCVCRLIKQYGIDPKDTYIQVSKLASTMIGTSARLKFGDVLSIWDLMHGLMLPSGNDAAYTLAESFGTYIYLQSQDYKLKVKENPEYANAKVKNPVKYFLDLMNSVAEELGLNNTNYANPHGLVNQHSHSTASDQAKLAHHCLKIDMIKEVVSKATYTCEIEQIDQSTRISVWENTNKLLGREGWFGIKTGVTTAAGPSFAGYYHKGNDSYIVIMLGASSMEIRWIEAPKLIQWIIESKKKFKMYQKNFGKFSYHIFI